MIEPLIPKLSQGSATGCGLNKRWSRILTSKTGRKVEIDSSGIAWDPGFTGGESQELELKERELVASRFLHSPKAAFREAIRHHSGVVMRRRARQILDELCGESRSVERVLVDMGTGFGWHWQALAREFPSITFVLIDFSVNNLLVCRALMPFHEYPNVLCLHADITDLPLETRVADFCWSVQVHQHLPPAKRLSCFKELKRVMRPGGKFYFAWLRTVGIVKSVHAILGKRYLTVGQTAGGSYLHRFDEMIRTELTGEFPKYRLTYSETLFHPDLGCTASSSIMGTFDLWLGSTRVAPLLARQVEIWGES